MRDAARRNFNAGGAGRTPRESWISAEALSAVVMVIRAFGWDDSARVSTGAPAESGLDSRTVSAVVVGFAALRDFNAGFGDWAPREAGSFAFTGSATVEVIRTVNRDADALLGQRAEGKSGLERGADSAAIVRGTAVGDFDACAASGAPGIGGISALTNTTIIVILGTFDRYLSASEVRRKKRIRTPTKRRKQAQTISAKIVELAADRNINAGVGLGTQRLAGWAELDA